MPSPWLKKNLFMSIWLSAASRVAASWRGQATAQAKRQVSAAVTGASKQNLRLWTEAVASAHAKIKPKRERRKAPAVHR